MAKAVKRTNRTPKKGPKPARKRSAPDWAPSFLECLADCGVIGYTAKKAGIGRTAVYQRRDTNADFAEAMATALVDSSDVLEYEGWRRAKVGTDRPSTRTNVSSGTCAITATRNPRWRRTLPQVQTGSKRFEKTTRKVAHAV